MTGMLLRTEKHKDRLVHTGHLIVDTTKTQALLIHSSVGFHFNWIIKCMRRNGPKTKRLGVRGYLWHWRTTSSLPAQTWAISKGANALTCVCLISMAFLRQDWEISQGKWETDELTLRWRGSWHFSFPLEILAHHHVLPCGLNNTRREVFFLLHLAAGTTVSTNVDLNRRLKCWKDVLGLKFPRFKSVLDGSSSKTSNFWASSARLELFEYHVPKYNSHHGSICTLKQPEQIHANLSNFSFMSGN